VFAAQSGRETTAMTLEHPVDLLITDLNIPDEDGIEIVYVAVATALSAIPPA
jgi:YesN/AraC family two-component response regulator